MSQDLNDGVTVQVPQGEKPEEEAYFLLLCQSASPTKCSWLLDLIAPLSGKPIRLHPSGRGVVKGQGPIDLFSSPIGEKFVP